MASLRSLLLLSAAALAAPQARADQVLVVGQASSALWHETRASSGFSAAGLADLALSSLGLGTGRVSTRSAVQSPLQADIFTHSDAFALLLLDDTSLTALNAALEPSGAFHELYPAQTANVKVPVAVAQEFSAKYPSGLRCAGSAALCASVEAATPSVSAILVQEVLAGNRFLDARDEQDVAFAQELAQVMQLTADVKQDGQGKTLYLVGLSNLQGDKQRAAQQAVTTTVTEFLAQLMKSKQAVGAQVMTGSLPTSVQQLAALSRRARNRRLVSGLENEESEEGEASEEEEEEEDLDAQSGSEWEDDDDNSTTTTNTTAPGAVSMPDIAEFQIILWTSVLLAVMLLLAVLAMANMDTGRDSLLYAKFIADVNGRKTN
uniref:Renin receptor-like C-terminal transmembrane spanning segment domain-containing protein n=1 Tax=Phytophthora ramorum TaxID=164328 RepID=H3GLX2_PHYRM